MSKTKTTHAVEAKAIDCNIDSALRSNSSQLELCQRNLHKIFALTTLLNINLSDVLDDEYYAETIISGTLKTIQDIAFGQQ